MSMVNSIMNKMNVPTDLRKVLAADPKTNAKWKDLTPIARSDFILWINEAKQAKTRELRIKRVPSMLASGKRRPCCFAVVPMDLYKALGANPKAKAQWKNLTPIKKRELISRLASAKETRKHRIEKVCFMLSSGKR